MIKPLPLCALMVLLSGCAAAIKGYPDKSDNAEQGLASRDPYTLQTIQQYHQSDIDKRAIRDSYVYIRLADLDAQYEAFSVELYQQTTAGNLTTDWLLLGLSTAVVLEGSSSGKETLAAISTALLGGKAAFDKSVLFEKTTPALLAQMEAMRNRIKLRIFRGLSQEITAYSLLTAIADLNAYYQAGTIPGAIQGITSEATAAKDAANDELAAFTATFVKDRPGDVLRAFWKPDGDNINPQNEAILRDWLNEQEIPVSITFFLRSDQYASDRRRAVSALKLE